MQTSLGCRLIEHCVSKKLEVVSSMIRKEAMKVVEEKELLMRKST
jgi:hypothetical protein